MSRIYSNEDCIAFVEDMVAAGFEPYHYHGRNFWHGPAVNVGNIQDAYSNTDIECQYDSMGRGYVVYPCSSDGGTEDAG